MRLVPVLFLMIYGPHYQIVLVVVRKAPESVFNVREHGKDVKQILFFVINAVGPQAINTDFIITK